MPLFLIIPSDASTQSKFICPRDNLQIYKSVNILVHKVCLQPKENSHLGVGETIHSALKKPLQTFAWVAKFIFISLYDHLEFVELTRQFCFHGHPFFILHPEFHNIFRYI